jgi:hypothetical protein
VFGPKQLAGPIPCSPFDLVCESLTGIIAPSRVPLTVLVGQNRAKRGQNLWICVVFRRDQINSLLLTEFFAFNRIEDLRIGVEEEIAEGGHGQPFQHGIAGHSNKCPGDRHQTAPRSPVVAHLNRQLREDTEEAPALLRSRLRRYHTPTRGAGYRSAIGWPKAPRLHQRKVDMFAVFADPVGHASLPLIFSSIWCWQCSKGITPYRSDRSKTQHK